MTRVSLRSLQVYCTTAELGSFKRAADALFVTPSAVSHQIKSLEQQLGRPLFERQARGVELTESGQQLVEIIGPLLGQVDTAVEQFLDAPIRQKISIAMPPFLSTEYFIPRLPQIARQHPHLDIRLQSTVPNSDRFPSEVDLAIVLAEKPPDDVSSFVLFPLTLVPVAAPSLALSRSNLTGLACRAPLIIHRDRRHAWRRWYKREGINVGSRLQVIEMDSMFAVARAAEQGLGVALVPPLLVGKWIESGAMHVLCDRELPTRDSYILCWREPHQLPFVEAIANGLVGKFE